MGLILLAEGGSGRLALKGLKEEGSAEDVGSSVGRFSEVASTALRSTLGTRGSTPVALVTIAVKGVMIFLGTSVVCG